MLVGIFLVAATLRFSYPGRLAVEHFDEGVYASNIWFGDRPAGVYPEQHLYAPPLLPALIEWIFVFLGPSNWGAMLPSQIAGTVTVILLWRLGRTWFGPVAGLTAAMLCAASEVHILLSRSALTDALLGMWWVAALLALRRACDSGRWSHALLAGYLIGMAWYTKYNGWMPLAITISAVVARGVCCRGVWPETRQALKSCLIAGVTAFAVWSPWLWSLQSKGGYASVMANHRQYVVGLAGWLSSFERQWAQLSALTGMCSLIVLIGAYVILLCLVSRRIPAIPSLDETPAEGQQRALQLNAVSRALSYNSAFAWVSWSLLSPLLSYLSLASQSFIVWWFWPRPTGLQSGPEARQVHSRDDLGHWLLLAWFAGLLLVTPLYYAYVRLTLPWLLAAFLGVALTFQFCWNAARQFGSDVSWDRPTARSLRLKAAALVLLAALLGSRPVWSGKIRAGLVPITDSGAYLGASRNLAGLIEETSTGEDQTPIPSAVYVYAEPALLFQLRLAGLSSVGPVGSLKFMDVTYSRRDMKVYLVVSVHGKADLRFADQFAAQQDRLKLIGSLPYFLGPLVALDQWKSDPRRLGHNPEDHTTMEVYEVLPP